MMGYLAVKDEGVKVDQAATLLDPFSDISNYLKLLVNAFSFVYPEEIPLTMPSFSQYQQLISLKLSPLFAKIT